VDPKAGTDVAEMKKIVSPTGNRTPAVQEETNMYKL
jgi:hypothetical protein